MAAPTPSSPERAPARSSRGAFAFLAGALAIVAVVAWSAVLRPTPAAPASPPHEEPVREVREATPLPPADRAPTAPSASVAPPPSSTVPPGTAPAVELEGVPPPAPGPDTVVHEPPQPRERTQDEFIEHRAGGIDMIDEQLERLAAERDEAERRGDTDAAHLAQVRITRLTQVRERRVQELEQARAGELTPEGVRVGLEAQ